MKKLTQEQFLNKLPKDKKYKVIGEYIDKKLKILVKDKHGEHLMTPKSLLRFCKPNILSAINKNTYCINKLKDIHSNKYTYNNFNYIGTNNYYNVICNIHGNFKIRLSNHLQGAGCAKCKSPGSGWSRTNFINISKGKKCTFYTLKCWNEEEEFYKIGITSNSVKYRYQNSIPYKYEVIQEIKGEAGEIYDLELKNKRLLKNFKYIPLIKFNGVTECYNNIIWE